MPSVRNRSLSPSPEYTLLVLPTSDPLKIGLYDSEGRLAKSFESSDRASLVLASMISQLVSKYIVTRTIYTSGPGSGVALKLCYIVLETLRIVKGIPCYACSLFDVNGNRPVKAMGKLYFMKEKETIITKKLTQPVDTTLSLPESIEGLSVSEIHMPDYRLPAV